MVKKLAILGFILVAVSAASMVWAGSFSGAIQAPKPTVMPAAAPACGVGNACGGAPATVPSMIVQKPKKLTTSIQVKMQYPQPEPAPAPWQAYAGGCGPNGAAGPPIPVAVPMWKFVVPWPPFVYYLPVE